MSKVAKYINLPDNNLFLQPEGYNPSGSYKDNGMAAAVTHAKLLSVKKIVCASTGNTSASAAMYASNEGFDCDVYIPEVKSLQANSVEPFSLALKSLKWMVILMML